MKVPRVQGEEQGGGGSNRFTGMDRINDINI